MIERAAILFEGEVYSLPRPARHHDVLALIFKKFGSRASGSVQGFLTSDGEFVDRELALQIAKRHNQLIMKTFPEHLLFSEDVW